MAGLPSWRVALAALLVAAALAGVGTAIVWQTSSSPGRAPGSRAEPQSQPEAEPGPGSESRSEPEPERSASPSPGPTSSPAAAERAVAAEVRSLVAAGQIGKARSRANEYFERFPDGPATAELERLTGAHPRR